MLAGILIVIFLIVALLIVVVAMQPSAFRIERTCSIAASPANVFTHVNNLHRWEDWSPWAKIDPNYQKTYEGPPAGTGAIFGWSGNNKVGEGRMTIVDSRPPAHIQIRLEFFKPFKATNTAEFTFSPEGSQTQVVWAMTGQRNFMLKGLGLFMNFDKMVGGDFEKGLAQLKSVVEAGR